ncbi:hypothetical protein MCO_01657 [Bartonella sp. DB5-6]|nr:hypothetical protein MCO_01657 [Bartonella sp. DB5-6]
MLFNLFKVENLYHLLRNKFTNQMLYRSIGWCFSRNTQRFIQKPFLVFETSNKSPESQLMICELLPYQTMQPLMI